MNPFSMKGDSLIDLGPPSMRGKSSAKLSTRVSVVEAFDPLVTGGMEEEEDDYLYDDNKEA